MKIKLYNEVIDLFFILSHKSNYKLLKPNKIIIHAKKK